MKKEDLIKFMVDKWTFVKDPDAEDAYYKTTYHGDFGIITTFEGDKIIAQEYLRTADKDRAFEESGKYERAKEIELSGVTTEILEKVFSDMFEDIIKTWVSKYLSPEEVEKIFS